jgi:hypothetical protein
LLTTLLASKKKLIEIDNRRLIDSQFSQFNEHSIPRKRCIIKRLSTDLFPHGSTELQ